MYTGLAPGYSQEIGNCLVFIGVGIGHSVQFVVSEYISAEANLFVFLIISVTAVHLFVVADSHYGSGSSSRRSCCSRKHDENSKTVNGQPEVLTELAGNATTFTCLHLLLSALVYRNSMSHFNQWTSTCLAIFGSAIIWPMHTVSVLWGVWSVTGEATVSLAAALIDLYRTPIAIIVIARIILV